MNKINYIVLFCAILMFGCSDDPSNDTRIDADQFAIGNEQSSKEMSAALYSSKSSSKKVIDGIEYQVHAVSSIDYLQRIGAKIENEDLMELKKETVFMLELKGKNTHENIFDSQDIVFVKDSAIQYLIGKIQNDFKIHQEGQMFRASGVNYEGQTTTQDRIRVTFYVKGIDLNTPYTVEYYDQLFGKGLIKFKRTANEIIS